MEAVGGVSLHSEHPFKHTHTHLHFLCVAGLSARVSDHRSFYSSRKGSCKSKQDFLFKKRKMQHFIKLNQEAPTPQLFLLRSCRFFFRHHRFRRENGRIS